MQFDAGGRWAPRGAVPGGRRSRRRRHQQARRRAARPRRRGGQQRCTRERRTGRGGGGGGEGKGQAGAEANPKAKATASVNEAERERVSPVHGCAFPTCRGGWAVPSLTCRSRFPLGRAEGWPHLCYESHAVPSALRALHRRVPSCLAAHPAAPATMDGHQFGSFGAIIRSRSPGSVRAQGIASHACCHPDPPRPAATSVSVIHPAGAPLDRTGNPSKRNEPVPGAPRPILLRARCPHMVASPLVRARTAQASPASPSARDRVLPGLILLPLLPLACIHTRVASVHVASASCQLA